MLGHPSIPKDRDSVTSGCSVGSLESRHHPGKSARRESASRTNVLDTRGGFGVVYSSESPLKPRILSFTDSSRVVDLSQMGELPSARSSSSSVHVRLQLGGVGHKLEDTTAWMVPRVSPIPKVSDSPHHLSPKPRSFAPGPQRRRMAWNPPEVDGSTVRLMSAATLKALLDCSRPSSSDYQRTPVRARKKSTYRGSAKGGSTGGGFRQTATRVAARDLYARKKKSSDSKRKSIGATRSRSRVKPSKSSHQLGRATAAFGVPDTATASAHIRYSSLQAEAAEFSKSLFPGRDPHISGTEFRYHLN
jgi:hypothetical protein